MAPGVSFNSLFNPDEMISVMEIWFDEILCMSEGLKNCLMSGSGYLFLVVMSLNQRPSESVS